MGSTAAAGYAERTRAAHAAMCERFERRDGTLGRDGRVHLPRTVAHVWPFARALVATLDLAGMSPAAPRECDDVIARRLEALERYFDERGPAYASDPPGGRVGGDIYYDDNAWVGLALVQLERMRPGSAPLDRAVQIAAFARGGWADDRDVLHPGGIYWVQQGRGLGARNHDRNAISTAPNGQVIAHLHALGALSDDDGLAQRCAAWVQDALARPDGLILDKIRGDQTIDQATWSYNQGSMVGLRVLLAQRDAARDLATATLDHYAATGYAGEPWEFVAILARNLLSLHAACDDEVLCARIIATLRERADACWAAVAGDRRAPLLAHAALVSLQALAAWDPVDYARLA